MKKDEPTPRSRKPASRGKNARDARRERGATGDAINDGSEDSAPEEPEGGSSALVARNGLAVARNGLAAAGEIGPVREHPDDVRARAGRLLKEFLRGRTEATEATYRDCLLAFSDFLGFGSAEQLVPWILTSSMGKANEAVTRWKNDLLEQGSAARTINLRLTAVRSLVRRARAMGLVQWTLEVPGVRSRAYRDTRGPGLDTTGKILAAAAAQGGLAGLRDVALVRLLFDQAMRRVETIRLDVKHVEIETGVIHVLGKGKLERVRVGLSKAASEALRAWLRARGQVAAQGVQAVFVGIGRRGRGQPIKPRAVNRIILRLAKRAGVKIRVTPHGFRHTAITTALDRGMTQRQAQGFARQEDPRTIGFYDDNLRESARGVADVVSDALGEIKEPEPEEENDNGDEPK